MNLVLALACAAPAGEALAPGPGADLRYANCVAQQVVDLGMDGVAEWRWIEHYDRMGRKSVVESDRGMDGDPEGGMRYSYLPDGREASHTWDGNGDGVTDLVTLYVYDAEHQTAKVNLGSRGVENVERFSYDDAGRVIEVARDRGGDGSAEERDVYSWEGELRVMLASYRAGERMPFATRSFGYEAGRVVHEATDLDDDGFVDIEQWTDYDALGRRIQSRWDTDLDGATDNFTFWDYDCPA